jgi:hypothetical protein
MNAWLLDVDAVRKLRRPNISYISLHTESVEEEKEGIVYQDLSPLLSPLLSALPPAAVRTWLSMFRPKSTKVLDFPSVTPNHFPEGPGNLKRTKKKRHRK